MNRAQFREYIANKQKAIVYESDEDEGAMDYYGELQSIIDAIDNGTDVEAACSWVGETCLLESQSDRELRNMEAQHNHDISGRD
jgi:hypothetical protein